MVLVFGCRQAKVDHIYREETLQARNLGVFRELYTAYSREPDKPKVTLLCRGPHPSPGNRVDVNLKNMYFMAHKRPYQSKGKRAQAWSMLL